MSFGRVIRQRPMILGLAGPSGSGKTELCRRLQKKIMLRKQPENIQPLPNVLHLSQDSFYRPLSTQDNELHRLGRFNWDSPCSLNFPLLKSTFQKLSGGSEDVEIQHYNFQTSSPTSEREIIHPHTIDLILFEGTLVLHFPELRKLLDVKVFLDVDSDICLLRRIARDIDERGRTLDHITTQYLHSVKRCTSEFCLPTKKYADILIKGECNCESANEETLFKEIVQRMHKRRQN